MHCVTLLCVLLCSDYKVTIGIDFVSRTMQVKDRAVRLQLWSAQTHTLPTLDDTQLPLSSSH